MVEECYACHRRTIGRLIKKFELDEQSASDLKSKMELTLDELDSASNPLVATSIHRIAREVIGTDELFQKEKLYANQVIISQYRFWKNFVQSSYCAIRTAMRLAVAANIIDYGAHTAPTDLKSSILNLSKRDLAIDDSHLLLDAISNAKNVLYLGDNAGEIVFDKLFIECMGHPNVTYVVRGRNVINDVTFKEAEFVGMNEVCKVISNGYEAPSTILERSSDELNEAYKNADLIISKGQGNFEGLVDVAAEKCFFLLMAKCEPIARMLGVEKGSLVIRRAKK